MSLPEETVRFMVKAMEHEIGYLQRNTDNARKAYEKCAEDENAAIAALNQIMDLYPYLKSKPDEVTVSELKVDPTIAVAIPVVAQQETTKKSKKLKKPEESEKPKESKESKESEESTKKSANYSAVTERAAKVNVDFTFPKKESNTKAKKVAAPQKGNPPDEITHELKYLLDLIESAKHCKFGVKCKNNLCRYHPTADNWEEAYKCDSGNFRAAMFDESKGSKNFAHNFARNNVESQLRTAAMLKGYNPTLDNWDDWVAEVSRFFHGMA